jgi:PAS domain S-box-containing protein
MDWRGAVQLPGHAIWGILRLVSGLGTLNPELAAAALEAYQQRLDEALAWGRREYDAAFDAPPAGIGAHEIDSHMIVQRVNRAELELLGYAREQVVGRPVVDFIVMDEASKRAIARKLGGSAELRPFVRSFRRADGSAVALLLLDRLLRDPSGAIVGIRTVLAKAPTAP